MIPTPWLLQSVNCLVSSTVTPTPLDIYISNFMSNISTVQDIRHISYWFLSTKLSVPGQGCEPRVSSPRCLQSKVCILTGRKRADRHLPARICTVVEGWRTLSKAANNKEEECVTERHHRCEGALWVAGDEEQCALECVVVSDWLSVELY